MSRYFVIHFKAVIWKQFPCPSMYSFIFSDLFGASWVIIFLWKYCCHNYSRIKERQQKVFIISSGIWCCCVREYMSSHSAFDVVVCKNTWVVTRLYLQSLHRGILPCYDGAIASHWAKLYSDKQWWQSVHSGVLNWYSGIVVWNQWFYNSIQKRDITRHVFPKLVSLFICIGEFYKA